MVLFIGEVIYRDTNKNEAVTRGSVGLLGFVFLFLFQIFLFYLIYINKNKDDLFNQMNKKNKKIEISVICVEKTWHHLLARAHGLDPLLDKLLNPKTKVQKKLLHGPQKYLEETNSCEKNKIK